MRERYCDGGQWPEIAALRFVLHAIVTFSSSSYLSLPRLFPAVKMSKEAGVDTHSLGE